MIHTPLTEVLKEAGFTPDNFYLHPVDAHGCTYIPVWHLAKGASNRNSDMVDSNRVTEINEHKVTQELV